MPSSQRSHTECLVQAAPMEEEGGAGGAGGQETEAPDMIPLDVVPEDAAKIVAKQKGGARGRGRGRGGKGRGAKVGRPCPTAFSITVKSTAVPVHVEDLWCQRSKGEILLFQLPTAILCLA